MRSEPKFETKNFKSFLLMRKEIYFSFFPQVSTRVVLGAGRGSVECLCVPKTFQVKSLVSFQTGLIKFANSLVKQGLCRDK